MTYYRRRDITDAEWALAGALGVAVGAATFYLARIWMQREPLTEGPPGLAGLEDEPEAELEAGGAEAELEAAEPDVESEAEGAEHPPR